MRGLSREQQAGSSLGRWLTVMMIFAAISTVLRQFVIPEPVNKGDFFNDVVGISDADSEDAAMAVGPAGETVVEDDSRHREETHPAAGKRTAVTTDRPDAIPVLEVRFFLGRKPLTQGTVFVRHDDPRHPGQQSPGWQITNIPDATDQPTVYRSPGLQVVSLDGTNEARVAFPRLLGATGQVQIFASYSEMKPGRTSRNWNFEARIPLPESGQRWIGPDFVLERESTNLLCSGKVVDEAGKGLSGCMVSVGPAVFDRDQVTAFMKPGGSMRLVTAGDGTFEIRHRVPYTGAVLAVAARANGFVQSEKAICKTGAKNLRIVMHRSGSVSGSVLLPKLMDRSWLWVGLLAENQEDPVARRLLHGDGSPCDWTLKSVPEGRYTLRFGYITMGQSLLDIAGIEVQAGRVCRDVRIQSVDLRGFLRVIRLSVAVEHPKGPLQCTVMCRMSRPVASRSGKSVRLESNGRAVLVIPTAGGDITLEAPGYRPIHVPRATQDMSFQLKRLPAQPRAEIQLAGGFPKKLPAQVWLELVPAVGGGPGIAASSFMLEGSFQFKKVPPGPYKVRLYLKTRRPKDAPRMFPDRDQIMQVRPIKKLQRWTVPFDHRRMRRFAEGTDGDSKGTDRTGRER